jgi:hypothetical protein
MELYFHPNTSSWRGAHLSTGTALPLHLSFQLMQFTVETLSILYKAGLKM